MTKEEALKGLSCCADFKCDECPYKIYSHIDYKFRCNYKLIFDLKVVFDKIEKDTYTTDEVNTIRAYERRTALRECENKIKELETQLAPFKQKQCFTCSHRSTGDDRMPCYACRDYDKYEWLGNKYEGHEK